MSIHQFSVTDRNNHSITFESYPDGRLLIKKDISVTPIVFQTDSLKSSVTLSEIIASYIENPANTRKQMLQDLWESLSEDPLTSYEDS